jgi:hypothetical protein
MILQQLFEASPGGSDNYAENLAQQVFNVRPNLRSEDDVLNIGYKVAVQDLASQTRAVSLFSRDQDFPSDFVSAYYYLQKQRPSMAEEVDTGEYDARRPTHKGETTPEQEKKFRDKVRQYGDELEQRQKEKEQGVAEGDDGRDKHYYLRNDIWRVMDGDELVHEYKPERYEIVGAKKLLARFDDEGYDVTHVISPMGVVTYLYGKPEEDMDEGVAEDSYKNSQAYRADGGANDENHELDQRRDQQEKSGTWYIRLNGKLIKDKQGNPYSFRGKAAANKAALTMQAKLFNQGKEFMLTTNPNDNPQGVAEASQRVDSLVTDALKIMQGATMNDAVAALKTVLGNREYNDRRGHYNFYVRQLMDMYGQQGVAEGLASKTKQISENQYIPKHKRW